MTAAQKAAAAKKAAAKKAAQANKPNNTGLGLPAVVKTKDVAFKTRATGSKYDAILEQAKGLKKGETLKIPVAKDADIVKIRNRLGAVVRRVVGPVFPNSKVRLRVSEDGCIAICVE